MSWAIEITTDKDVTIEDVEKAMRNLRKEHGGLGGGAKQTWGWTAVCDVQNPKERKIAVSGADFSYKRAPGFVEALTAELNILGFATTTETLFAPLSAGEKSAIAYQREVSDRERRHNPLGVRR